ncbi:MAG: 50S ribosomal protein L23 [Candidatus Latescibacteria bacterium]|nr:50S ribosomal protein L23 [Candidatus Latescibacterota bacterium]
MNQSYNILNRPILTEKATAAREATNTYTFRVVPGATKVQIRQAVESIFSVHVKSVRTVSVPSRPKRQGAFQGRRSGWKKAYVSLKAGESIALIENI